MARIPREGQGPLTAPTRESPQTQKDLVLPLHNIPTQAHAQRSVPAPQLNVVKTVLLLVLFHMPQSATPRLPKTNRKQVQEAPTAFPKTPETGPYVLVADVPKPVT